MPNPALPCLSRPAHSLLALVVLAPLGAASPAPAPAQDQAPPVAKDRKALVEALLAVEPYRKETRAELDALLAPYASAPAPTGSKRKKVLKDVAKLWSKGAELPTKGGEHWYFEEGKRGRYFVSGRTKKPKGLFIGLHGGGVGSADASGSYGAYQSAASSRGWVALFPQALEATERGWTDSGTEEWIMRLIDEARRTYDVPPDRVYIGGHSMGGYGSWVLGAHHADLFAAAVPSAGAPTPILERGTDRIIDMQEGVIPSLRNLPMCVFQSTDDPRVGPGPNQHANVLIGQAKEKYGGYADFTYWEVADRGHGYPKGGTDALLERIEDFEREPHPDRVVWQPVLEWR
ncbi:MAG: alpha/beta hydrolase-fold protein, partial [Planctomycetota bacterium]